MEFNEQNLQLMEDDDISLWGEYADNISSKNPEFAERIYQRIIALDGEHTTALSNYAEFLQEQGRYKEAKLIYTRLLQLEKDNNNLYFRYGAFCVETGDLEGAERFFLKFMDRDICCSLPYCFVPFSLIILIFPVRNDRSILNDYKAIKLHIYYIMLGYIFLSTHFCGHYKF